MNEMRVQCYIMRCTEQIIKVADLIINEGAVADKNLGPYCMYLYCVKRTNKMFPVIKR